MLFSRTCLSALKAKEGNNMKLCRKIYFCVHIFCISFTKKIYDKDREIIDYGTQVPQISSSLSREKKKIQCTLNIQVLNPKDRPDLKIYHPRKSKISFLCMMQKQPQRCIQISYLPLSRHTFILQILCYFI